MNMLQQVLSHNPLEPPLPQPAPPPGPLLPSSRTYVRLVDLLDMLLQRAYHDLILLAEMELAYSQRKTDLDRKLDTMAYLSRTRNLFVRFLALLKWSSNMSKVDKCFHIINTLEEQSALFVETADVLARLSRETLANSKLPCYQVSFAVDVLNSRTCPRLPSCIKDKIIPPEPLTAEETADTLWEVERALLYRLVTSDRPPLPMRHFVVRGGRAVFTVAGEFRLAVTLMGDDKSMPFFLLDLDILVEHTRVGEGKALVHPQQVVYLKQLVQTRIMEGERPLDEVYAILHHFCQSLKLEVLYSQVSKYMINTGLDYYRIDAYKPASHLTLAYWEDHSRRPSTASHALTIALNPDADDQHPDFLLTHIPPLPGPPVPVRQLDVQELLMGVVHARVKERLQRVEKEMGRWWRCVAGGLPWRVGVELFPGCGHTQMLCVGIGYYTGLWTVRVEALKESVYVKRAEDYLNSTALWKTDKLVSLMRDVYLDLVMSLVRNLTHNMLILEYPRLAPQPSEAFRRYEQLGPHSALFRLQKKLDTTALLCISAHDDPRQPDRVRLDYHMLLVEPQMMGVRVVGIMSRQQVEEDVGRASGPPAPMVPARPAAFDVLKQRLAVMKAWRGEAGASETGHRFRPRGMDGLEGIVAGMSEMSMFGDLRAVLKEKGWTVEGVENGVMRMRCSETDVKSVSWRRVGRLNVTTTAAWSVDMLLTDVPFQSTADPVAYTFSYESSAPADTVVEAFLFEYHALRGLLRVMRQLAKFRAAGPPALEQWEWEVEYNLKQVKINYGPGKTLGMLLSWSSASRKLVLEFVAREGSTYNPHRSVQSRLMELLNRGDAANLHKVEFVRIVELLALTTPLVVGARAVMRPVGIHLGRYPRLLQPQSQFQLIPLSLAHYVVSWRATWGVLVQVHPGRRARVSDLGVLGAPWQSVPGLAALLEGGGEEAEAPVIKSEPGLAAPLDAEVQQSMQRFFDCLRDARPLLVEGPARILRTASKE